MASGAIARSPGSPAADPRYLPELLAAARVRDLARSRPWQVLVHYRRTPLGGWRSEADGEGFFLAGPAGRRDPEAELEATLTAFFAPAPAADLGAGVATVLPTVSNPNPGLDAHAQCRFPARFAWLKETLAIDPARLPDRPCPLFEVWRQGIAAQAVTLVYATAYLNSPASMYGHTFLRLSRATGEGNPLLDYIVNFAADVDTDNGLVYAWRGLTGGFPGRYYLMPYYVKVQEYSNIESRDLWEYPLSLSPAQVDRLVRHAWETRNTHFDYFFFTRNCSYQLLTLLEVADPSLHLVDGFGMRVIPADTVRVVLAQAGLVRGVVGRPSLAALMKARQVALTADELRAAEAWLAPLVPLHRAPPAAAPALEEPGAGLPADRRARILDAAYDYARYQEGVKLEPSVEFKRRERRLLLARGRLGLPPPEIAVRPAVDAPERGHSTLRVAVGGGASNQAPAGFETLSIRAAIHDYLDPPRGYPGEAQMQMGHLRLRYANDARTPARGALRLDRVDLVDIVSAAPLERWLRSVSWKVWMGVENARELGCERPGSDHAGWRCLYAGVSTGGGLALRLGPERASLLYLFAETDLGAGPAFAEQNHYRIGGGVSAGLLAAPGQRWRMELGGRAMFYALGDRRRNLRARVAQAFTLGRRADLRLAAEMAGTYAQLAAELCAYF